MEGLAWECIVLIPRKLPRNTLLVAIAVDWASTIGGIDPDCILHEIRSEFRCRWWFAVKDNEIGFGALPKLYIIGWSSRNLDLIQLYSGLRGEDLSSISVI
jgi:hypothetical protein